VGWGCGRAEEVCYCFTVSLVCVGRVDVFPWDFPVVRGEAREDFPALLRFFECDGLAGGVLR